LEQESSQATALISEKILLFEKAKGQLLPVLTVKTDNVKNAKHSASITPVKPENLLFLTSRGISMKDAEDILKKGFLK
jgi:Fe-S cluster assembly scaffold protein SufB